MNDPTADALGFAALPGSDRARIEAELTSGERLLWASAAGPRPTAALLSPAKPGSILLIALAICTTLLLIGIRQARSGRLEDPGPLMGAAVVPVITAVISLLVTLSAWSRRRRNRSPVCRQLYALTDRRVVVWEPADRAGGVEVLTVEPSATGSVHRLEYPDGSGEVRISFVGENPETGLWPPRSLVGVADVRRVESMIRAVLVGRSRPTRPGFAPAKSSPRASLEPDSFEEPF